MISVLIVDDSAYMRTLIRISVTKLGLTVTGEAENGKSGVDMYKKLKPDVVFMDIMMEELYGNEALKQIMEYDSNAVVIMVSSVLGQSFIIEEMESLGAKALLKKPPDEQGIKDALIKCGINI
ncbi:MAG: response regulator [Oscillospiraceae bacterium]|nr:response regulator [Oscillospiraceae bacterium]